MSNMILLYLLILGTLLSKMHGVSTNAAGTPHQRQRSSGRQGNGNSAKKSTAKKKKRQQKAGFGVSSAHLSFDHDQEDDEDEEWECFPGSSTAQKSHVYISSEKMVHTKLQNVPLSQRNGHGFGYQKTS